MQLLIGKMTQPLVETVNWIKDEQGKLGGKKIMES